MEQERRVGPWPAEAERQRRESAWPEGEARQRRRTRWSEFREAYPRIVTAMALGMLLLVLADVGLLFLRSQYRRESAQARQGMSALEKQRADALLESEEGRTALMLALVRQQSVTEKGLNLAISLEDGTMDLQREGSELRQMRVEIGPEAVIGQEPGAVRVTPPLGKRHVARVVDASYVWEAPEWVYLQRGRSVPASRGVKGGLGHIAVLLDDGTPLYSRPAAGPLADESYVLPGGVRVDAADLAAIRENLTPGLPVYFF
jgi:hypothetical protein